MRNPLNGVLNWMRIIVKRIYAPFVTLPVMGSMCDSINCRVSHINVRRRHINLGSQSMRTVFKLAIFHSLKEIKIFFNAPVSVRTVFARLSKGSAILTHLFRRKVAYVCLSIFDKFHSVFIALVKVIGSVIYTTGWLRSKPRQILIN